MTNPRLFRKACDLEAVARNIVALGDAPKFINDVRSFKPYSEGFLVAKTSEGPSSQVSAQEAHGGASLAPLAASISEGRAAKS